MASSSEALQRDRNNHDTEVVLARLENAGLYGYRDLYYPELVNRFLWLDAVMVSLDFEGFENGKSINEIGVATFDLRQLLDTSATPFIKTRHFCNVSQKDLNYMLRSCLFATPERIDHYQLKEVIQEALSINDPMLPGEPRKIILVGQSPDVELAFMKEAFDIDPRNTAPVVGVLDTYLLSRSMFDLVTKPERHTLRQTLDRLKCPYRCLHYAGNDANFALRALFLLADRGREAAEPLQQSKLHLLRDIALTSLPADPERFQWHRTVERAEQAAKAANLLDYEETWDLSMFEC